MKRKLFAILAVCTMLFSNVINVSAANAFNLSKSNQYSVTLGGGTFTYTVPFTANYELTLAGTRGAAYSNNSGGPGYTLTKTVRLNYGDEVKVELPTAPSYSQSGSVLTIPGGSPAKLWINGTLYWSAAGGQGKLNSTIAPNGVTTVKIQSGNGTDNGNYNTYAVHWHSGNGVSGASHSNSFPELYGLSDPGGCYVGSHVHDSYGYTCPRTNCPSTDFTRTYHHHCDQDEYATWVCNICGVEYHKGGKYADGDADCSEPTGCSNWGYSCGNMPHNIWNLGCNTQQGQILGYTGSQQPGTCYTIDSPSAALTSTGNAYFTIKLAETETLFYKNVKVPKGDLRYLNNYADLVILDNTVCYFKRR